MSDTTKECKHETMKMVHLDFPTLCIGECANPECGHRVEYRGLTLAVPSDKLHIVPTSEEDGIISMTVRHLK